MVLCGFISDKKRIRLTVPAIIAATLLNGLFLKISTTLALPFFLDSIYTVVITVLFGLWPGLLTGLLSNFFFEVLHGHPGYLYPFAIVNMGTSIVTWLHIRFQDFNRPSNALWLIISLSIANSILGAIVAMFVFEGITDQPFDSIVRAVVATGQSIFSAAFYGRLLINIVDKGIAVLVAFPIYRSISSRKKGEYSD